MAVALLLRAWRLRREVKDDAFPRKGRPIAERSSEPAGGDAAE
jgi:hypothetical protein